MAKKKLNQIDLFIATEELLLSYGYHSFQFKTLSERLEVGRSTLYDYYRNKEELISDYMVYVMDKIIAECGEVTIDAGPEVQLKRLITLFMKYSQLHEILQVLPLLQTTESELVRQNIQKLEASHGTIKGFMMQIITKAQRENVLRTDIQPMVIAGIVYNCVNIPNMMNIELNTWATIVYDAIVNGIKPPIE